MNDIPGIQRRTKIVCTIGPPTSSRAQLRALLERGMNVARLNFAHGEPAEHGAVLAGIRVAQCRSVTVAALSSDVHTSPLKTAEDAATSGAQALLVMRKTTRSVSTSAFMCWPSSRAPEPTSMELVPPKRGYFCLPS
jgi:pyruvate kinase